MKIMIVGAWQWLQYEEAFSYGLQRNDVAVSKLATAQFFQGYLGRLQQALPLPGMALFKLNRSVIKQAVTDRPDAILFWRPTHILPSTLKALHKLGILTASYNNDDPFGPRAHGNVPWHHHWLWFWHLRCLPYFHRNFFFRQVNCEEALNLGARHAKVLMPYFIPWKDKPVELSGDELDRFESDVVFAGHYEADGREDLLQALINAKIRVRIWGGHYWQRSVLWKSFESTNPIRPAEGDDYRKALCGAKICLAFLSKLNRDSYTRRCFEIPACGQLMLAERTNDLLQLFREDEEAVFFSSQDELIQKVEWLLENPEIRNRIAAAGLRRVWSDHHDVISRAHQFLANIRSS
jgi:spore maturation protein CgeB